jgi:hypothetical protein
MPRTTLAAAGLAVLIAIGGGVPGWVAPAKAASCSNWTSQVNPPPTIRVFRHLTGAVETVDFRTYAKNVLSREWIGSWTTESLRSGALAVKHYAWYQALHWRGGMNTLGTCFDLRDDTADQVYDPSQPTWSTAAAAVDATWSTRVLRNGSIFPTYYNAGSSQDACGANANGWKLWQWGTQACGLAGRTAAEMMQIYYYPGVTVADAPPPGSTPAPTSSPTPAPTPTPVPTATPAATASPSGSVGSSSTPAPTPLPTPLPTARPTPVATTKPTPRPLPTPPPAQGAPGGGQAGVAGAVAPPPPPAADPSPVLVSAGSEGPSASAGSLAAWEMGRQVRDRNPAWLEHAWEWALVWPVQQATDVAGFVTEVESVDPRLATFRTQWGPAAERLLQSLARGLADGGLAFRFVSPRS